MRCVDILNVDEATMRISICVGRLDNPLKLVTREIIGWNMNDLDPAKTQHRIFFDISASLTLPKETDDAVLFFLAGEWSIFPGRAESKQCVEVYLIDEGEAFNLAPYKELFAEDDFEFGQRVLSKPSSCEASIGCCPFGRELGS